MVTGNGTFHQIVRGSRECEYPADPLLRRNPFSRRDANVSFRMHMGPVSRYALFLLAVAREGTVCSTGFAEPRIGFGCIRIRISEEN